LTTSGVGMISDLIVSLDVSKECLKNIVEFSGLGFVFFIVLTLMLYSSTLYIETIGSVSVMIEVD